ncbi:SMP-30/gluconolactonase/LRE family protein [Fibrisoma montanum]|uniref:SMP-30/gluconolactonase/LRE family protein n=1 Tax=Fibrisoma montanum TaxID=2305895 RepID=A0A418MAZ2_9BACT|nr:SMP-30/gluconolactonase/LRE family protein [Fibrisoma montanum]RIV23510.1 SMP-30/gluconolactonase/LRE family protein [Fibrisoma montanum]
MHTYYRTALHTAAICVSFLSVAAAQQPAPAGRVDSVRVVAPGATLTQVSNQFTFTEGPTVDRAGNVYFTDQPNDKIWKYDASGTLSLFMDKTGRSNGLYMDKQGNIIACADDKNELWSINPANKSVTVLLTDYQGKRLNGPNDLWLEPKGGIFFTDPYYQRNYWTRKEPDLKKQSVYYLPKGTKQPVVVDSTLQQPNGIVGTPDGKFLYVADIRANKTYKYQINPDGSLANRQLFVEQGSDGMALDAEGNLYLTGRGVTVYDPTGKKLGTIPVPSRWVGNLCFGGMDRRTLFITASESVYTLPMRVKGVE